MNDIVKHDNNSAVLKAADEKLFKEIAEFQKTLNSSPDESEVKVNNQISNKPKYLPIGVVEKTLDEVYSGLWNTLLGDIKVVANEIVYTITLEVFHPVAKTWLRRVGTGAAQIRMKKDANLTDYNDKIKVALVADAPHALSEALKNAAGKFGVKFGRNLNRGDDFSDYKTLDEILVPEDTIAAAKKQLADCTTPAEVKELFKLYKEHKSDLGFKQLFIKRGQELPNK